MTSEVLAAAPLLRDADGAFAFEPHHCFACGDLNERLKARYGMRRLTDTTGAGAAS